MAWTICDGWLNLHPKHARLAHYRIMRKMKTTLQVEAEELMDTGNFITVAHAEA
jgi:hypothetical protein